MATDIKTRYSNIAVERIKEKERDPFVKRILVVDDEPDIALTFGVGFDINNYQISMRALYNAITETSTQTPNNLQE